MSGRRAMMELRWTRRFWLGTAAVLGVVGLAVGVTFTPTPKQVTNTTGGKNQNPSVDKKGNLVVFTSNVNRSAAVSMPGAGAFDFNDLGNDFRPGGAAPP